MENAWDADIMEDFGAEFEQEDERFVIDSDAKAEWAIRKIADEQAERDRLVGCCQAEIDRYKMQQESYSKRFDQRTAGLRALLREYFDTVKTRETKTQRKYELPSGGLVLKKASKAFKPDPDKLRDWLETNKMLDYLKFDVSPRWAMVKEQLMLTNDGYILFAETGEIVPNDCVILEAKPEQFEVKMK